MPDILNFQITPLGSASVNVPRAQIEGKFVNSANQSIVLADLTGANALIFPAVIGTLTAPQRLELAQLIAGWLLRTKAGL